ncbi:CRISPR-associated protein Cas6 [Geobacillus subterraneus]|jgi:CRISPR-associated endoribonuclease Cas6|uniref:CRISPR-associated endoribonuclease n=3 Tax=Geobacillus TaxID=129337 RepID=A0A2Z3N557_GEOTH|nr:MULTISPECIES: CRISPR-associated endoribonuclease Cas6 [Geobacillus]AMX84676.1 CRISPR-associated protein Cas6 [Geobacillus subterraneus]AOL33288.1 CRISPR-associated endoribonuclease Cas6 [Geobacillus thermoleovorans]AWO74067.1 CRISPR-associated endoribonuclease Cas6 [Geobacillus thermoleovorans]EQB96259.1 CRISPR-associated protein Cas6 [Geobacillus sp. A8]KZS25734.1 CRISPR-associated endoribonuclease Cas6 [Geobacillus subterraneus]
MRLTITMNGRQGPVSLPLHYQHLLQGLLYRSLESERFATFLHEIGFRHEKRSFKLFTFSRLVGRHEVDRGKKTIRFLDDFQWHIDTILPDLTEQLGQQLLLRREIWLYDQPVEVQSVKMDKVEIAQNTIEVAMLSPLTVYSTYETIDGKKKTHFFGPDDDVFPHLVELNFRHKYEAYYGVEPAERLVIQPVHVHHRHRVVTRFKDMYITGWLGHYRLSSSPEQLTFLYHVGLGSRNSQGFGMFRLISE